MQLVQEHTILAEVARLRRERGSSSASPTNTTADGANGMAQSATGSSSNGPGVDQLAERPVLLNRTERLANSLGHLCGVVTKLNACPHDFSILLMAGECCSCTGVHASALAFLMSSFAGGIPAAVLCQTCQSAAPCMLRCSCQATRWCAASQWM